MPTPPASEAVGAIIFVFLGEGLDPVPDDAVNFAAGAFLAERGVIPGARALPGGENTYVGMLLPCGAGDGTSPSATSAAVKANSSSSLPPLPPELAPIPMAIPPEPYGELAYGEELVVVVLIAAVVGVDVEVEVGNEKGELADALFALFAEVVGDVWSAGEVASRPYLGWVRASTGDELALWAEEEPP